MLNAEHPHPPPPPPPLIPTNQTPTSNVSRPSARSSGRSIVHPAHSRVPDLSDAPRNITSDGETPKSCSLPKAEKELVVFRFLQECKAFCIVHVLVGGDAPHKLFSCSVSRDIFRSFKPFRSQIRYSQPGICYRCGVPTSERFDHPFRSKGADPTCKYDDILKPLAFAVFSIPSLRDIVIPEAGGCLRDFPSIGDYAKWLGEVPTGLQSMSNLWEVCHAYVHLFKHNRCV